MYGIVGFLALLLVALVLSLLLIPFDYRVHALSLVEHSADFRLSWFFGLIGVAGEYEIAKGFSGRAKILGISVNLADKGKKDKEEKKEKKNRQKKKKSGGLSYEGLKVICRNGKAVLRANLPKKIEGHARIGFSDPYHTGIFCSWMEFLRGIRVHNLKIDYVFEDEVYEGEVMAEGRVFLIHLAYLALKVLFNKSARRLLIN